MVVTQVLSPKEKDLGEFSVRRVLPSAQQRMIGPWIFFDHMGPAAFVAGNGINVRPHPHINLATVTYLFEGEIFRRDSLGNELAIHPGDINLMVAGRGITHSERERPEIHAVDHTLHGLQLWHALPEADEEVEPAFYHYAAAALPRFKVGNVPVRLMMGSAWGQISPVKTFVETLYAEAHLPAGATLVLPEVAALGVYVLSGQVDIAGVSIEQYHMAVLDNAKQVTVTAQGETRIALIGGAKMSSRFIEWNFVSSRKERIEQAKVDWQAGRFAKVVNDEDEFIPLPGS